MPPAKAKLKAVAQAASVTRFVNVPRLTTPPNYGHWLNRLLDTPQNRKVLKTSEKSHVDELLRLEADRQFRNDSNLLGKALAEISAQASADAFARAKARYGGSDHTSTDDDVLKLKLPPVGKRIRGACNGPEAWAGQTYEDYTEEAKRINPGVSFNKPLMDAAFRIAMKKLHKHTDGGRQGKEAMRDRCLGKESDRYWGAGS